MNLIIDIGNSFSKLAVFERDEIVEKFSTESELLLKVLKKINKCYRFIDKAIISSVGKLEKRHLEYLKTHYKVLELNAQTSLPFKNLYKTPNTLGIDRMALVSASINQYPKKNALIIDAGTCITYDFVTAKKEYLGGAISPGINMRYKALNNLTANLPLLSKEVPNSLVGDSTFSAIHSGVIHGVLKEIDGNVKEYQQKYPDLTIILTGGDANFLSKQLKSSIFANSNFLLEGLNFILQFNSN